jgi:O-antigen/teichoic acid export membrane protein
MTYYVIGFGSVTLLFFAWARPVVGLFAASAFEQAHVVVGYCAAAYFLVGVFSVLLPPLYYAKEVWAVTLVQGVGALAAICLQLVLIDRFGVLGAAIGLTSGFLILCLLLFGWLRLIPGRYLRIRYDWPRVLGFGGVIVFGAAVLSLPAQSAPLEAVGWATVATAIILVCALMALRFDERRAIAAAIRAVISR